MRLSLHLENIFEKWKYNIEWDVEVSSFGRLRKNGQIITPKVKDGYLWYDGGWKPYQLHRLVAQTFKPTPGWSGLTVDHLDHNTRNNHISNLEWVPLAENLRRARRDELVCDKENLKPETASNITVCEKENLKLETASDVIVEPKTTTTTIAENSNSNTNINLNGITVSIGDKVFDVLKSIPSISAKKLDKGIKSILDNSVNTYEVSGIKITRG